MPDGTSGTWTATYSGPAPAGGGFGGRGGRAGGNRGGAPGAAPGAAPAADAPKPNLTVGPVSLSVCCLR
jgi:hypothetical protein